MSDAEDLATAGIEYFDRVLAAEHAGFVQGEEKATKYAQALALMITTAALGGPHFRAAWTRDEMSQLDLVYVAAYVVGGLAMIVAGIAIWHAVRVEDTPGLPADRATAEAFKSGASLDVLHDLIDRYAASIESMRGVNRNKFRYVTWARRATYVMLVSALVALTAYLLV